MKPRPLILVAYEVTRWTDLEMGDLLGIPKSSVQAIRAGRMPEKLTAAQRDLLIDEMRGFADDVQDALAEIEMRP